MKNKGLVVLLCLIVLSFSDSNHAHAGGPKNFTNADLMGFSIDQRHAYYTGSIISISHTLSLYDKEKGKCFSNWFFENPQQRINEIEAAVQEYTDEPPSSIILSLPQLKCGRLKEKQ